MKILELFSGTESFSKVARELGHETFTIDNNPEFKPDLCIDISELTPAHIPREFVCPDIIWASPPCTTFSMLSVYKHWKDGKPKTIEAVKGMMLVVKTIELINQLEPKYWFIENPRGMLRTMPFMDVFCRKEVTYCQYGDTRMKPTDIWTNFLNWQNKPRCKNGMPCHVRVPRGAALGTQGLKNKKERAVIPPQLCLEILQQLCNKASKFTQEKLV